MSNEMIAILGVGVALGLFNWRVGRIEGILTRRGESAPRTETDE
ncbi:MAG: hypothetical protein OXK20_02545 [Deltaproteobacteria bacterium]|nr:hypothetical protein [Deltaproteobacteria bacterium]